MEDISSSSSRILFVDDSVRNLLFARMGWHFVVVNISILFNPGGIDCCVLACTL